MRAIETVLFDLDGTLIDSIELILESYRHTMRTHGHGEVPDTEWMRGVGTPLRVQLSRWARTPEEMDALVATYRDYNLSNHDRMITIYPGVRDMVSAIRSRGLRTGVVTSKNREGTARGLALVGPEARSRSWSAPTTSPTQAHPEPVQRALGRSADPATTIFVVTHSTTSTAAVPAEVLTGAVLWGPSPVRTWLPPSGFLV
jgi:pyrophosphatase PpaX